ncbi:efflux RND transporter periplasmic adaptor subunit [Nitrosomonas eutropha]|uniref:RND family efflux transporter MFP subunit n=2 Tax=Nitrosomonas eutropha TaxID=916 RepID=A0ABX5M6R1_9PROT|nr:efflux RND transporter periplasmic adaptor subunit [Nitrosomonas eutropha]ABI59246.1 efflux transporter, RND family, MFP subunit [Nitrosomonas eutropha C91]PXV81024.1 RND family efflux transporter MFP subunit [Nitrosomonas eutropha]SEJ21230.1 RND family efflux transporter, MFP subunit [Nitrosomonas eutropha]
MVLSRAEKLLCIVLMLMLTACGKQEEVIKIANPPAVSVATARNVSIEVREESIGSLEGIMDPTIAAEVSGRVLKVLVRQGQHVKKGQEIALLDPADHQLLRREALSEVARLEALLENQQRSVERNTRLVERNFISQIVLDDVKTQEIALRRQLEGAKSRLATIEHNKSKTRLFSPMDGKIESQTVVEGDYVKVGDPLLQIISNQHLRAHLPFPESIASYIRPNLEVRLSTPTSDTEIISHIRELKPAIGVSNRAIDALVYIENQPGWHAGASVSGVVILGVRENVVVVPEQSVVLRPAGQVVYAINGEQVEQRVVRTGLNQDGMVEIIDGVQAGEQIVLDGAAFLTDGTKVTIQREILGQANS